MTTDLKELADMAVEELLIEANKFQEALTGTEATGELARRLAEAEQKIAERDKSLILLRRERNVLQKIAAERAERLEIIGVHPDCSMTSAKADAEVLRAASVLEKDDWEGKELLPAIQDVIDAVRAAKEIKK